MKNKFVLFCAAALTLAIISCKKDSGGASGELIGTWKFISLKSQGTSTSSDNAGGTNVMVITKNEYTTENNNGTLIITGSEMQSRDLSYSVNSTMETYMYTNGVMTDSFTIPFVMAIPPTNSSAPYTKIGNDSIYLPQGGTFTGGVQGSSQPGGVRYRMENDLLLFTGSATTIVTDPQNGQPSTNRSNVLITYQRQ